MTTDLLTGLFLGSQALQALGTYGASRQISSGYSDASTAIANAGKYGIDLQFDLFDKATQMYDTYRTTGENALNTYQNIPLPSATIDFKFDPSDETYKIQQEEGEKAINRALAARGLYNSRSGINVLSDFNRKLIAQATQEQYGRATDQYNREYQLAQTDLNRYANLINAGLSSTNALATLAAATGRSVAEIQKGIGNAQATAAIGKGQANAGLIQDLSSAPSNALSQYYLLQKLMAPEGATSNLGNALTGTGTTGALAGNPLTYASGTGATGLGSAAASTIPSAAGEGLGSYAAGLEAPSVIGAGGTAAGVNALAGTQAAADVISGTQAGTLSALGSGGGAAATGTGIGAGLAAAAPVAGVVGIGHTAGKIGELAFKNAILPALGLSTDSWTGPSAQEQLNIALANPAGTSIQWNGRTITVPDWQKDQAGFANLLNQAIFNVTPEGAASGQYLQEYGGAPWADPSTVSSILSGLGTQSYEDIEKAIKTNPLIESQSDMTNRIFWGTKSKYYPTY